MMYAIALLCILAALILFFFNRSAGKGNPEPPIPTYTCHTCDQQDCECTLEDAPPEKGEEIN